MDLGCPAALEQGEAMGLEEKEFATGHYSALLIQPGWLSESIKEARPSCTPGRHGN